MTNETDAHIRALAAERAAVERTAREAGHARRAPTKASLYAEVAYLDERLDELLRKLDRIDPAAWRRGW